MEVKKNGSKNEIKKNGTEESSFLQNRCSRFQIPKLSLIHIYSDPKTNPDAKKFDEISIQEVIEKDLKVVDMTASILCKENKMPMLVFGLNEENSIVNAANGKINGTRVTV